MRDPRTTIRAFILSRFLPGEPASSLPDDRPLYDGGVVSSLGKMEIVQFLEETYGISIEPHETDDANFGTVDALVAFVEEKLGG